MYVDETPCFPCPNPGCKKFLDVDEDLCSACGEPEFYENMKATWGEDVAKEELAERRRRQKRDNGSQ